jgi:1-aminocyclopropane-1-carboxylate deaminase/D-cysteine desulfhydrase-like pyridoxal-dependent ACC family enzyme
MTYESHGLVIDHVIHARIAGTRPVSSRDQKLSSGIQGIGNTVIIRTRVQAGVETPIHISAGAVSAKTLWRLQLHGDGYGPTEGMNEAVLLLARLEGVLFDPVYTGKALAGMIDLIRKKEFSRKEKLLFIHTGGSAGLFGYSDRLKTRS